MTSATYFGSKDARNGDLGKLVEEIASEIAGLVSATPSYTDGIGRGASIPVIIRGEKHEIEVRTQTHTIGAQEIRLVNVYGSMELAHHLQATQNFFDTLRSRGYNNCPQLHGTRK